MAVVFQHLGNGTNNVNLYLDGALVGTASNIVWSLKQNYPLVFGGHASTGSATYRWFNGSLDDLALFRGALATNETSLIAARTVSHFGGWTVTNSISVNVVAAPPNTPPVLAAISNCTLNAGITLTITNVAIDTDQPPQTLIFGLVTAPPNAAIASDTGLLLWRPTVAQADSTNLFSVTVTDNGTPNLSATQNFVAVVNPLGPAVMSGALMTNSQFKFLVNGDFGPDYTIQTSTNLTEWTDLFATNAPALPFDWIDTNSTITPEYFYRLKLEP